MISLVVWTVFGFAVAWGLLATIMLLKEKR